MEKLLRILGVGVFSLVLLIAFAGRADAQFCPVGGCGGGVPGVPEVDPTAMGTAIALLAGGYLVAVSRFRRSK